MSNLATAIVLEAQGEKTASFLPPKAMHSLILTPNYSVDKVKRTSATVLAQAHRVVSIQRSLMSNGSHSLSTTAVSCLSLASAPKNPQRQGHKYLQVPCYRLSRDRYQRILRTWGIWGEIP